MWQKRQACPKTIKILNIAEHLQALKQKLKHFL